jgi:hypothetical protein
MGISSIVTAALPIPVTLLKFIPIYSFQTKFFSVLTSLFCFLLLAYIFYRRHALASLMFPSLRDRPNLQGSETVSTLPAFCILGCLASTIAYIFVLALSVKVSSLGNLSFNEFLQLADPNEVTIRDQLLLFVCYLGIFVSAMGAFVLMAIKEFLQDALGIVERDLLAPRDSTTLPNVTWTNPPDGARDVSPDVYPAARFSTDMKYFAVDTFKLFDARTHQEVPLREYAYDEPARMATIFPDEPLETGKTYAANIVASVEDEPGHKLTQDHTWYFRVNA